jgi:hypothetical protein
LYVVAAFTASTVTKAVAVTKILASAVNKIIVFFLITVNFNS